MRFRVLSLWLLLLCLPVPHVTAALTSPPVGETDQQSLSNKEVIPRVVPLLDAPTVTFSTDTMDIGVLESLSQNSTIANPAFPSTPSNGQKIILRMMSSTPRALTWGSQYTGSSGVDLPATTTGGGAVDYYEFYYNTTLAKWQYRPGGDVVVGGGGGGGTGDFVSTVSTSVDSEMVLYAGTTGKQGKRSTGDGIATLTAGVLGSVPAPVAELVGTTAPQTLENKAIPPRVLALADGATLAIDADTTDIATVDALTQAAVVSNPTGTARHGQRIVLRIRSAAQQNLTWDAAFAATSGGALPTRTKGANETDYFLFYFNATLAKWEYVSSSGGMGISTGFAQYTLETLPNPCNPYEYATLIGATGTSLYICGQTGDAWSNAVPQVAVGSSTTNPTGIASGTGEVIGVRFGISNTSINKTLGLEHTVCVDTGTDGVTLTLPAAVNSPVSEYAIVICAGTGQLTLQPAGTDLLAGVNAPQSMTGIRSRMDVSLIGAEWHLISTKVLSEESAMEVLQLPVTSVRFPSTNPARLDNSETNPRLIFAETPSQCAIFGPFLAPPGYVGSPSLYTVFSYAQTQVGSVTFILDVSVMATNSAAPADVNTESYDTVNTCTGTSNATVAGYRQALTCALTNNDGILQNALVKLKLCLNVSGTALGDVEVLHALFRYVR